MDNIILVACGVIVVLMVVGVVIIVKDQTAPIGRPPSKKPDDTHKK